MPLLQPARVVRCNIPRGPLPLGAFRHICTGTGDSHRAHAAQRSAGAEPAGRRADAAARQPDRSAHRNTPRVQPSLPRGRRCRWPSGPAPPVSETRAEALHRIASHRIASVGLEAAVPVSRKLAHDCLPPCSREPRVPTALHSTFGYRRRRRRRRRPPHVCCERRRCRGGGENGRMGLTRREPRRQRRRAMTSGSKMRPGERPVTRTTGTVEFHVGSEAKGRPKHEAHHEKCVAPARRSK